MRQLFPNDRRLANRRLMAAMAVASLSACGGGGGGTDCGHGALGLPSSNPCVIRCDSWVNYVEPAQCCCSGQGCTRLQPDLAAVPARAVVKVGERFVVGSGHTNVSPSGCNTGNWNNRPTWSTGPSVLMLESTSPASFSVAQFVAVAPGTATVAVEDARTASGDTVRIELTACSQLSEQFACLSRLPLQIVVVP